MVKGVNKTVIEVNDTGSKMFEKIVFYVSPKYGNLSTGRLTRAAGQLAREFEKPEIPLRTRMKRRRRAVFLGLVLSALAAVSALILLILL